MRFPNSSEAVFIPDQEYTTPHQPWRMISNSKEGSCRPLALPAIPSASEYMRTVKLLIVTEARGSTTGALDCDPSGQYGAKRPRHVSPIQSSHQVHFTLRNCTWINDLLCFEVDLISYFGAVMCTPVKHRDVEFDYCYPRRISNSWIRRTRR
jgi:hypothetical protein